MSNKFAHLLEMAVFYVLSAVLAIYIAIEMLELVYQLFKVIFVVHPEGERLLITREQTKKIIPVFFNILIAAELFDTLKSYIHDHSIKVQSILLIGLMAIGRKLLILDYSHTDGLTNLGLAALILSLSAGYYFVKAGNN
jgi:uncharacterized membrane protein (DUF373 family)